MPTKTQATAVWGGTCHFRKVLFERWWWCRNPREGTEVEGTEGTEVRDRDSEEPEWLVQSE